MITTESNYINNHIENPTYEQIYTIDTSHTKTVQILFDPTKVTFKKLATIFFKIHDPTQLNRQKPNQNKQYHSTMFTTDNKQTTTNRLLITKLKTKKHKIITKIQPTNRFWPTKTYHQNYYKKTNKTPYYHAQIKHF